ncbi:MAG: hypothetical protein AAB459_02385 [Patescibacteria group bacterium]
MIKNLFEVGASFIGIGERSRWGDKAFEHDREVNGLGEVAIAVDEIARRYPNKINLPFSEFIQIDTVEELALTAGD